MERVLSAFFIEEPTFGPSPTEADRAKIASARRWTVGWGNWTIFYSIALVVCFFVELSRAIHHLTFWWVPIIGLTRRVFGLFGCALLLMVLMGHWLDANREAGMTVVYPPTLAQEAADLLNADRRPLLCQIAKRSLLIWLALTALQLFFG